ncbi:MAG: DEAD/DEAH box helicase [Xanthobacteraceae bacterium]|nr:DEAD/DEAH box helicase [Xanthobacteraceae bacterium]
MTFSQLGLSDKVLAAVSAAGYTSPTPIQEQAIPHVLARRDVLGIAQTGTGKTAAFVLPMLTKLEQGRARARMPRTLIIEPTRELAAQVEESFAKYGVNHKLNVALLIGGVSFDDQDTKLVRGVDVLIATPGRLLDHFERGRLLMSGVELLVIDEADRMLDMGFIPDIERICKLVPFTRQTLFFTATMPPEIRRITEQFLHNPVRVEVARPASTVSTTSQNLVKTGREPHQKRNTLRRLIRAAAGMKNAIIFCNRKREVATLHRSLLRHGFSAVALHGDMDQSARTAALEQFRKNEVVLLVASDVAARGLDIPDVSHVFNFDVPHHADDYVHRIGRTGRAGRSGAAITIVAPADQKAVTAIEKLIGQTIPWAEAPPGAPEDEMAAEAPRRRGERDQHGDRHERHDRSRSHGKRGSSKRPHERGDQAERHDRPEQHDRPERYRRPDREERPDRHERPAKVASIENARPRRAHQPRANDDDGDVAQHLPAFLLRPVRVKA